MSNMTNIAALLRDDITTIQAVFEEGGTEYTFKTPLHVALGLSAGDLVAARVRQKIKVVTVVRVNDQPQIDPDVEWAYQWAFQPINTFELDQLREEDDALVTELNKHRRKQVRDGALSALGINDVHGLLADAQAAIGRK